MPTQTQISSAFRGFSGLRSVFGGLLKMHRRSHAEPKARKSLFGGLGNQKGLTLIEVLTVAAVLGILASAAIPSFNNWIDHYQADVEAREVYFDLLNARSTAISRATTVVFNFDVANNSYTFQRDGGPLHTVNLEDRTMFGYNAVTDIDGNALSAAVSFGGGTTVTFNAKGQATQSGAIYMIPKRDLGNNSNRMRAIRVVQTTGNISLYSYKSTLNPPWE